MTREQIEKAAGEYSGSVLGFKDNPVVMNKHKAFMDGAQWRINSVWHDTCDIAEPGKDCLVEYMDGDGNVCIRIDRRSEYEWINACHYDKILRWAYISDLFPERKEETK